MKIHKRVDALAAEVESRRFDVAKEFRLVRHEMSNIASRLYSDERSNETAKSLWGSLTKLAERTGDVESAMERIDKRIDDLSVQVDTLLQVIRVDR